MLNHDAFIFRAHDLNSMSSSEKELNAENCLSINIVTHFEYVNSEPLNH